MQFVRQCLEFQGNRIECIGDGLHLLFRKSARFVVFDMVVQLLAEPAAGLAEEALAPQILFAAIWGSKDTSNE